MVRLHSSRPSESSRRFTRCGSVPACGGCKQDKTPADFHRRGRGYQAYCKACKARVDKRIYQINKPKILRQKRQAHKTLVEWSTTLKKGPCSDCKLTYHHAAMQWDHLPCFEKHAAVSRLVQLGVSKNKILKEIAKCELVCANCHAVRTFNRRGVSQ